VLVEPPQTPPSRGTGPGPAAQSAPGLQPNVKIDVTFIDTLGGDTPQRKTVSMLVYGTGRHSGRIRSQGTHGGVINIDATPAVYAGDGVSLNLTIEYLPEVTGDAAASPRIGALNHSITVGLPSGKPVVVAQSADPGSARRVTVEVTATIMR
jgi:hypothetical protein